MRIFHGHLLDATFVDKKTAFSWHLSYFFFNFFPGMFFEKNEKKSTCFVCFILKLFCDVFAILSYAFFVFFHRKNLVSRLMIIDIFSQVPTGHDWHQLVVPLFLVLFYFCLYLYYYYKLFIIGLIINKAGWENYLCLFGYAGKLSLILTASLYTWWSFYSLRDQPCKPITTFPSDY